MLNWSLADPICDGRHSAGSPMSAATSVYFKDFVEYKVVSPKGSHHKLPALDFKQGYLRWRKLLKFLPYGLSKLLETCNLEQFSEKIFQAKRVGHFRSVHKDTKFYECIKLLSTQPRPKDVTHWNALAAVFHSI